MLVRRRSLLFGFVLVLAGLLSACGARLVGQDVQFVAENGAPAAVTFKGQQVDVPEGTYICFPHGGSIRAELNGSDQELGLDPGMAVRVRKAGTLDLEQKTFTGEFSVAPCPVPAQPSSTPTAPPSPTAPAAQQAPSQAAPSPTTPASPSPTAPAPTQAPSPTAQSRAPAAFTCPSGAFWQWGQDFSVDAKPLDYSFNEEDFCKWADTYAVPGGVINAYGVGNAVLYKIWADTNVCPSGIADFARGTPNHHLIWDPQGVSDTLPAGWADWSVCP